MTAKNKLILVRGLPGSGKSTLASKMDNFVHYETDMYRCRTGPYVFDHSETLAAHTWCQEKTLDSLKEGKNVVVCNSFIRLWEMEVYADMVVKLGCEFDVVECEENYGNIHGIPENVVARMKLNWEELPFQKPKV